MDKYLLAACIQAAGRVAGGWASTSNSTSASTLDVFWNALGHAKAFAEENSKPPREPKPTS